MNGSRKGSQKPTLLREPPDAVDWTISDLAVDYAKTVGYELDEWQSWAVRWAFVRRPDGLWAARDYGLEVPRQNGKNIVLEVIEIVAVFALGEKLVIHSAHRTDVSHEHFLSLKEHIEASPDLDAKMPTTANRGFVTANGKESIQLANGNRILFKSRQGGSGRGPRPQRLVFDEALILAKSAVGDQAPGMTAQKNPQIVFASSPPKTDSPMLHKLRGRALKPRPKDRLFYAAWNNPPETDLDDMDAAYRVNPSLGYGRMTEDSLLANRDLMDDPDYLREHMGVPEDEPDDEGSGVFPADDWSTCAEDPEAPYPRPATPTYAIEVDEGGTAASIAASDGTFAKVLEWNKGSKWLVEKLTEILPEGEKPWLDPAGPAGSLLTALAGAGIEWNEVTARQRAQACGELLAAVTEDHTFVHADQPVLNIAQEQASTRPYGDAWAWERRNTKGSVSPLDAVTIARWAARQGTPTVDLAESIG